MSRTTVERSFERFRDSGDPDALAEVFDRTAPELYRLAGHLAGSRLDAEDLVQATFLTAIESAAEFDRDRRLVPWLVGILANHARKARRRERGGSAGAPREAHDLRDPLREAEAAELARSLVDGLAALPEPYAPVLRLYFQHGLSPREIAETLNRTRATVRSQVHRGLELLRRGLPAGLAGGVAVGALPGRGLAAVRDAVLSHGGGASAGGATAVAGIVTGGIGMVSIKKAVAAGCILGLVALVTWQVAGSPLGAEPTPRGRPEPAPRSAQLDRARAPSGRSPTGAADREAVEPQADPVADEPADTGTLVVEVTRDDTAAPGVAVELMRADRSGARRYFPLAARTTDRAGGATFTELTPGAYLVSPRFGRRATVEVSPGQTARLAFELPVGVVVTGTVVDDAGIPVAGARIYLDTGWTRAWSSLAVTDARGRFELPSVPTDFRIGALAKGFAPSHHHAIRAGSGERYELTIVMRQPAATIRGRVLDPDDRPVRDAFVAVLAGEPRESYRDERGLRWWRPSTYVLRTDDAGSFVCDEAPTGRVIVLGGSIERPDWLRARVDLDLEPGGARNVDLRLGLGATIEGTVRRATGEPAAGLEVHAVKERTGQAFGPAFLATEFDNRSARTDPRGRYRIGGLASGRYRTYVEGLDPTSRGADYVELGPGELLREDLRVAAKSGLWLRLSGAGGEPLAGWQVSAQRNDGGPWLASTSDVAGDVTFEPIDEGAYTVYVETPGERGVHHVFAAVYLDAVPTKRERQIVRVGRDQLPTARIEVRALAPDGRVASGARLILMRRFGRHFQEGVREADERGRIDTGLVPPGKYDLTLQCRDHASLALGERVLQPGERLDLGDARFR